MKLQRNEAETSKPELLFTLVKSTKRVKDRTVTKEKMLVHDPVKDTIKLTNVYQDRSNFQQHFVYQGVS